jgi:mRNA interferase MazF
MPEVWNVVRVPLPYTDRPVRQHRPALVIAAPASNGGLGLLWVLMITSAANRGWLSDVMITDCIMAGLPVPSLVRTAKVATIERRMRRRLDLFLTRTVQRWQPSCGDSCLRRHNESVTHLSQQQWPNDCQ